MPIRDAVPHLPAPEMVGWETTLRCNMRCRHCGSTAGDTRPGEMDTRAALAMCQQFADVGVSRVVLTGGETLLRPDWEAIVEKLIGLRRVVALLTNGWVLNKRVVKTLSRLADERFHVAVSIDGTRAVHDDIRGLPGSFDRAFAGARMLREAGLQVGIITTVSHANLDSLPALGDALLGQVKPYCWQLQITTPFGRAASHGDLNLSQLEYARLATFLARKRQEDTGDTKIVPGDCLGYLSSIEDRMRDHPWPGCQAGLQLIGMQSNGNVKGCLSIIDDAFVEGNAQDEGLERIWNRPGAFAFTRRFKKTDLAGPCRTCPEGSTCRGGCSASSISVYGKAGHAPYCLRAIENQAGKRRVAAKRPPARKHSSRTRR